MLTNNSIINYDFKPLTASQTVRQVLERLDEHELEKIPVVDTTTNKLIGQVTYRQLLEAEPEASIADLDPDEAIKIYRGQHVFEAARLMLQYELRLLPVVDKDWTFLGVIEKRQVLEALSQMLNLAEFGSVITVEVDPIDFSISEIVQLIETEGAKILGVTVESPDKEQESFEVSIKLNLQDVSRVVAALRRYDYSVIITESEAEAIGMDIETRADELLKYIDM